MTRAAERQTYQLSKLAFRLEGSGPVHAYLAEEFACLPEGVSETLLTIRVVDSLPPLPRGATLARGLWGWKGGYQRRSGRAHYRLEQVGTGWLILLAQTPPRHLLERVLDWNYLSRQETVAKDFMYAVFNLIAGLLLADRGWGCLIHASTFLKGEKGVAIIASGGAGKTTTLLKLVSERGWKYLSDDIGLLEPNGTLVRTPLRMQLYAYNFKGEPQLTRRMLAGRPLLDRLSWFAHLWLKGPKKVRRRVSPEHFFGAGSIGQAARLTHPIFIERTTSGEFECRPLARSELIQRLMAIMPQELGGVDGLVDALTLTAAAGLLPDRTAFRRSATSLLESAFAGTDPILLRVPAGTNPRDLAQRIAAVIES